jgi:hypothetical protein
LRCSASILSVAGLSASGRFFFPVIGLRGMDVQDMAIVVHLWHGLRTFRTLVRIFCVESRTRENYKR